MEDDHMPSKGLESREPSVEDLVGLCRELNKQDAKYIVIGGFAMRAAGYDRRTMDIDLLIDISQDNEERVFHALESLPDKAVKQLKPGEVERYVVVRVADEIVVDLMKSACAIEYKEAAAHIDFREVDGVPIPFASPLLLWRMKKSTHREKDAPDPARMDHTFPTTAADRPARIGQSLDPPICSVSTRLHRRIFASTNPGGCFTPSRRKSVIHAD